MTVLAALAHQGGWDEVLLVLAPLSIFALLLYVANARATRQLESRRQAAEPEGSEPPPDPPATDG
jgi:hypothetical protein